MNTAAQLNESIDHAGGYLMEVLAPFEPTLPLPKLIEEVNRVFHSFESSTYDARHPEIYEQLPAVWTEMVRVGSANLGAAEWRVLNFGSGTGFEASLVAKLAPHGRLKDLVCYDPSKEMLERCESKVSCLFDHARFVSSFAELGERGERFNMLITNSVLHHLPDPYESIKRLSPFMAPEAVWLAGHEPSSRYYRNSECMEVFSAYQHSRRRRRYLNPANYLRKLREFTGASSNPLRLTARESFRRGFFKQRPSVLAVDRLVDFHVAHSSQEASAGRGFDYEQMQKRFADTWRLAWMHSYCFMGNVYEKKLPERWQAQCAGLAKRFPNDGGNFAAVWVRRA